MLPAAMREFFQRNHIICLATASGGQPYSTPLFYHFVEADVLFCFLSSADTRHAGEADRNEHVSAAVYAPARTVADLQGAQILGTASWQPAGQVTTAPAFLGYLQSYPEAQEARTGLDEGALQFWTLRADWIKFTDNRRGFGHKEIWSRS